MSEEARPEPQFWTLRKKLFFLTVTLAPLLFFFFIWFSDSAFYSMGRMVQQGYGSFSWLKLMTWTWYSFISDCRWIHCAVVFTFPAIMYVLWWFRPSFLKSYTIVLLVAFICWRIFVSIRIGSPDAYFWALSEYPAFADQIPAWLKFLIY